MDPTLEGQLPAPIEQALSALTLALKDTLGDALRSVVLYGSGARGDYDAQHSDLNLLVVLDEVTTASCDAMMAPLHAAQRTALVHVELVTPKDIARSADVFPLKFLDIQRHHRVLLGQDPLQGVQIAWDHLRLRVEQQIKSLMFELRAYYLTHKQRPELLQRKIAQGMGTFLVSVGALLYLRDPQWWITGKAQVAEQAIEQLDLDRPLMTQLLAVHRHSAKLTAAQVNELYDHFMALVDQAADIVDELTDASQAPEVSA